MRIAIAVAEADSHTFGDCEYTVGTRHNAKLHSKSRRIVDGESNESLQDGCLRCSIELYNFVEMKRAMYLTKNFDS